MSNTNPKMNVDVNGSQLQALLQEFERQREMMLKLCETQNALLAGVAGNVDLAAIQPATMAPQPQATPEPVPTPAAPPPAPEAVQQQPAAPVVDNTAEIEQFLETTAAAASVPTATEPVAEPTQTPAAASGQEQAPADLFEYVRSLMARAIEMPESDIDPDQNIMELGADSMTAMSLVKEVETRYNIELPATLLFEYSTLNELVDFLREEVGDDSAQQA